MLFARTDAWPFVFFFVFFFGGEEDLFIIYTFGLTNFGLT